MILEKLRRSTSSTKFIPEIDGLRFFAILTVVVFHLHSSFIDATGYEERWMILKKGNDSIWRFSWWIIRMDLGVKVFFAISGFVLALPFFKNDGKVNLRSYYLRRLTRLEPPFIISLIGFYMVHIFLLDASFMEMFDNFLLGLIYSHVIFFGEPNPINPVTWSLETEAQFYIFVPMFFYIFFHLKKDYQKNIILLIIFFLGIFFRSYFLQFGISRLSNSILAYCNNFIIGIFFAKLWIKNSNFFNIKGRVFDLLGLISIIGIFYFYKPQVNFFNNFMFNVGIIGFFFSVFKGNIFNWCFTRPVVYVIGGMCYSIYLIHYAFFHFLVPITSLISIGNNFYLNFFIQCIIAIPIMLIVSALFYWIFERPFMNKNLTKKLDNTLASFFSK